MVCLHLSVAYGMMRRAEPDHIKRPRIIFMMGMYRFGRATTNAGLFQQKTKPQRALDSLMSRPLLRIGLLPLLILRG